MSVVVAVRHGDQILRGEVLVPRERWDVTIFVACLDAPERPTADVPSNGPTLSEPDVRSCHLIRYQQ